MKTILLIEDDYYISDLYKRTLEKEGYSVVIANDGEEGKNAMGTSTPDLVILDIMLPKINGMELLQTFKEDPKTKSIPVLIMSNLAQDEIIKEASDLGAAGFIIKAQNTPSQIVEQIKTYLKK